MEPDAKRQTLAEKLENYQPSVETQKLIRETKILLLVGVSGAGKDTIKQELLKTSNYISLVSHTTRPPRVNFGVAEQEGVDYHFINFEKAETMVNAGEFVEAKFYGGNLYGTSVAEISQAHDHQKIAVTDVEVQGVAEYKNISPDVVAAFILPPNYEEWQRRLRERYGADGVNPEDLQRRLQTARAELNTAQSAGYFEFVINTNFVDAARQIDALVHRQPSADATDGPTDNAARQLIQDFLLELDNN